MQDKLRLNVFIARCLGICRRKADKYVFSGKVEVNNQICQYPGYIVKRNDIVKIDNKKLSLQEEKIYAFYKPYGAVTTRKDPYAKKTIYDYLPKRLHNLFPVGRLDRNSEGLLILTNNGHLCYSLTHPSFEIEKEYELILKGVLTKDNLQQAIRGVEDQGEVLKIKRVSKKKIEKDITILRVVVTEGKKRHLRRIFKKIGYPVLNLKRIRIAKLKLGKMAPGEIRKISLESILPSTFKDFMSKDNKNNK